MLVPKELSKALLQGTIVGDDIRALRRKYAGLLGDRVTKTKAREFVHEVHAALQGNAYAMDREKRPASSDIMGTYFAQPIHTWIDNYDDVTIPFVELFQRVSFPHVIRQVWCSRSTGDT